MKLLLIHESPLEKIGEDYYAVDPWIRFPLHLATRCKHMTLWAPVVVREPGNGPSPDSWRLELGTLRVAHHDSYHTFVDYYKLWLRKARRWKTYAERLIQEHDVVVLRHPSPMLGVVAKSALRIKKPFVVLLVGDVQAQSDRILASHGLKKLIYTLLMQLWVRHEIRWCRNASLIYAYGRELAARHHSSMAQIKLMQTPHVSLSDFVYRKDTCQGAVIRLLRVCWLIPSKGLEFLLEAVALLARKGVAVQLEMIGKERVRGYRARLEAVAEHLGIGQRVQFSGWLPFHRIGDAYLRSDIQVISSLAEGTPRVIVEGAARGLPLVCTTTGGSVDMLRHEIDALLVPPAEPIVMAKAIQRIIDDGKLRRLLIEKGYEKARQVCFENMGLEFLYDLRKLATNAHDNLQADGAPVYGA